MIVLPTSHVTRNQKFANSTWQSAAILKTVFAIMLYDRLILILETGKIWTTRDKKNHVCKHTLRTR